MRHPAKVEIAVVGFLVVVIIAAVIFLSSVRPADKLIDSLGVVSIDGPNSITLSWKGHDIVSLTFKVYKQGQATEEINNPPVTVTYGRIFVVRMPDGWSYMKIWSNTWSSSEVVELFPNGTILW